MGTEIQLVTSSSSRSVYSKFNWKINNFSKLNAQVGTCSDVFSVGDYKWKVKIFPKGEGKVYDHLSLYLKPVDLTKSVETEFSFAVTSQTNANARVRIEFKHTFPENRTFGWGRPKFMPLSDFHNAGKGYLVNDTCVITIEVTCTTKEEESNGDGCGVKRTDPVHPDKVPECKRCKIKDERL